MRYIAHSVRSAAELKELPSWMGIHVEVRDRGSRLIAQPEPFCDGEDFESLLTEYRHCLLIAQLKSEGIAIHAMKMLELYNISSYYLLGCATGPGEERQMIDARRCAIRVSGRQSVDANLLYEGVGSWLWIQSEETLPWSRTVHSQLRRNSKLCLTSPETQGGSIAQIADCARQWHDLPVDAICTRRPDLWQAAISQLAAEDASHDVADHETLLSLLRQAA